MRKTKPSSQPHVPSSIDHRFNLIPDYIQVEKAPLGSTINNCFTVIQNPLDIGYSTELLSLDSDNNLIHFFPDQNSHSGWNCESISTQHGSDTSPDKLVAFYEEQQVFAFLHRPPNADGFMVVDPWFKMNDTWGPLPMNNDLRNVFGSMKQTDVFQNQRGKYIFYGVSDNADQPIAVLASADTNTNQWTIMFEGFLPADATGFRLLPGFNGNQLTFMWIQDHTVTFQGASITSGYVVLGETSDPVDLQSGTLSPQQIFTIPSAAQQQGFLLHGEDHSIIFVTGYDTGTTNVKKLTGGDGQPTTASAMELGVDGNGNYVVFAIDSAQKLWTLRQDNAGDDAGVTFLDWFQLGDQVRNIAAPQYMTEGPEIFQYTIANDEVEHLTQSASDRTWLHTKMATPSVSTNDPLEIHGYTTEMHIQDSNGNNVPNTVAHITASRKAVIRVNGFTYHIDSNKPALVAADEGGVLTISETGTSLTSHELSISFPDQGEGNILGPFRSDKIVHKRMAGQDQNFSVSGDSLKTAGFLPSDYDDDDADSFATKLKKLGSHAMTFHDPDSQTTPDYQALHFNFGGLNGPEVRTLNRREFQGMLLRSESTSAHWFGDIVHAIEKAVHELETIAVSVVDGVFTAIINGINYTLDVLEKVGRCMELIMHKMVSYLEQAVDAIKTALKWLATLFNWDDILNTHKVISHYLTQTLDNISSNLATDIPNQIITAFTNLKDDISQAIDKVEDQFQDSTFNSLAPATNEPAAAGGNPLEGQGLHQAHKANSVRSNYVKSKSSGHFSTDSSDNLRRRADATTISIDDLLDAFKQSFSDDDLAQSKQKISNLFSSLGSGASFLDVGISVILEAIKDLVIIALSTIEAVLSELATIAGDAITALQDLLEKNLDIPIISWLYKKITGGEELTIQNLFCLILAAPVTILYKAIYGGANATAPFTSEQVESIISGNIPWPQLPGQQQSLKAKPLMVSDNLDRVLSITIGLLSLLYAYADIQTDRLAAQGEAAEPKTSTFHSFLSIMTSLLIFGFAVPHNQFKSTNVSADIASISSWLFSLVPIATDVVFFLKDAQGRITRFHYQDEPGPKIMMVYGVLTSVIGLWLTISILEKPSDDYSIWNGIEAFLPGIPLAAQPLVTEQNPDSTLVLVIIDGVFDIGTGICRIVGTYTN